MYRTYHGKYDDSRTEWRPSAFGMEVALYEQVCMRTGAPTGTDGPAGADLVVRIETADPVPTRPAYARVPRVGDAAVWSE